MDESAARALLRNDWDQATQRLHDLGLSFDDIVEASRDSNADDEHDPEGVTVAVTRAQVASLIASDRRKLEQIEQALARVNAGTYGECMRCGGPIPDGRLEARPSTPWCVTCAQTAG